MNLKISNFEFNKIKTNCEIKKMRIKMYRIIILIILFTGLIAAQNLHPKYEEGMKDFRNGNYQLAESKFSLALEDDFFDAEIYYMRGLSRLYQNKFHDAVIDFTEAINLKPDHADAYNSRGLCYGYLDQKLIAMPDFNKAIELDPEFGNAYINRASLQIANKNYDAAMSDLDKALEYSPNNPELYLQRGRLYHKLDKYSEAIQDFSTVLRKGLKHNKIYFNRANSYFKMGDYENAIKDYSHAIERNPDDLEALNNRAMAYEKLGMHELAYKDRKLLNDKTNLFYTPLDELKYKNFSSSNGEVNLEMPDNWHFYEITSETGYRIVVSKDSIDPHSQMLRVGVTINVERNMFERYNLKNDFTVLEFWKGSQEQNMNDYHSYTVSSKTEKHFHGYPSIFNTVNIQPEPNSPIYTMYEFVIAYKGNLVFMYFQSPQPEFAYYGEIFKIAKESFKLNPDAAE
jgi:tetratricopeptide (TPR) repeat protein